MSTSLLTRPEVAKRLRVSERTLDRLIDSGKLAAVKIGHGVRISEAALDNYVASATR